jgi:hypothetical protein
MRERERERKHQSKAIACLGLVAGVGRREDDGVVAHREAVLLVGAAEDPVQRLLMRRGGARTCLLSRS